MPSKRGWLQAESVRKAEEERLRQEAKESILRANKERLDRLQAAWKEDQQLKEVHSKSLVAPADKACCSSPVVAVTVQSRNLE